MFRDMIANRGKLMVVKLRLPRLNEISCS